MKTIFQVILKEFLRPRGQNTPDNKPILEINPEHKLIEKLKTFEGTDDFDEYTSVIFDQAMLSEGAQLDDPVNFIKRINRFLVK